MGESLSHMLLVKELFSWVVKNYLDGDDGRIFVDLPDSGLQKKPPRIKSYTPDIYVSDTPGGLFIIGEAKTGNDIDNYHTREQIKAFLHRCSEFDRSLFVFAVPWDMVRLARFIVDDLQKEINANNVKSIVLDKLFG